jgi:hypothetical protein
MASAGLAHHGQRERMPAGKRTTTWSGLHKHIYTAVAPQDDYAPLQQRRTIPSAVHVQWLPAAIMVLINS